MYYEFHGVLATSPSTLQLRAWEPYQKHMYLRFQYSSPTPLLHLPFHSIATQPWRRLLTAPAARAPVGWAHWRILSNTPCSPPRLAQALQPRLHDTVDACILDLQQLPTRTPLDTPIASSLMDPTLSQPYHHVLYSTLSASAALAE